MREITTHITAGEARQPQVLASEDRSIGGAPDNYKVVYSEGEHVHIPFVTLDHPGVTNESLLAVLIDRMEGFQAGPFACEANAHVLSSLRYALGRLQDRTLERRDRGVEGKAEK